MLSLVGCGSDASEATAGATDSAGTTPAAASSPEERFCAADLKTPLDGLFAVAGMGRIDAAADRLDQVTAMVAAIAASGYQPAAADVAAYEEALGPLEDVVAGPVTSDDLQQINDGIAAVGGPGIALWERQVDICGGVDENWQIVPGSGSVEVSS
jgi:hypothetical protein